MRIGSVTLSGKADEAGPYSDYPSLEVCPEQGKVWASWVEFDDPEGYQGSVVVRRLYGGREKPERVSPYVGAFAHPHIAYDSRDGLLHILCLEFRQGGTVLWLQTLREPDLKEIDLTQVETGKCQNPTLCWKDEGELFMAWENYREGRYLLEGKSFRGGCLSPLVLLAADFPSYRPHLAANRDLFLLFDGYHDNQYSIFARVLTEAGWSDCHRVSTGPNHNHMPKACRAGTRGIWASWESFRTLRKGERDRSDPAIVIPFEGFGWRVDSKVHVKALDYDGDKLLVSEPAATDGLVPLPDDLLPGKPVPVSDARGNLQLFVRTYNSDNHWSITRVMGDAEGWRQPTEVVPGRQGRRVPVVARAFHDKVLLLWQSDHRSSNPGSFYGEKGDICFQELSCAEKGVTARANWAPARQVRGMGGGDRQERRSINYRGRELFLFWGDLHMHSDISACSRRPHFSCGRLEDKYRFVRDAQRLDFAAVADHGWQLAPYHWGRTERAAAVNNIPGRFVTFSGYEWSSARGTSPQQYYGHRHIVFKRERNLVCPCNEDRADSPPKLWRALTGLDFLAIPHHPASKDQEMDWDSCDPEHERLVEVFQVRGSYEDDDCDLHPSAFGRDTVRGKSVQEALKKGLHLGFTAGGEHEGVGVTAVLAEELSREAIFEALRRRRCYATTGCRVLIDFRVNDRLMGEVVGVNDRPEIYMHVEADRELERVELVIDGTTRFSFPCDKKEFTTTMSGEPVRKRDGCPYYYLRLFLEDGEMAWSSPIWLQQTHKS